MLPLSADATSASLMTQGDLAACRALLRGGSRTFHAASLFLPRDVRDPATALYAFCRVADDAIDASDADADAVERLTKRLDAIYRGAPADHPADRAFAHVVSRYMIPKELPAALIEGFAWDAAGRQYRTLDDLADYAARVAGTVGAMMSLIMGARSPEVVARACDLGIAMQYTNIARDVGEDARNGRLYLPRRWLEEAGIDPDAWLANPVFSPALAGVIDRLLRAATDLYTRAETGVSSLPAACRPGMHAARRIYAAIGDEVARRNFDSVSSRAYVSAGRKLALLTVAGYAALATGKGMPAPPLPAAQFLVSAIGEARGHVAHVATEPRVVWLINLFERLERRSRMEPGWG